MISTKAIRGRTITGTFRLTSTESFIVDASGRMVTKMYDPKTQKWNSSVKDQDKLVTVLFPLHPPVCIGPIPD
ncbi:hypothetical protein Pcinc_007086 [Petrolisthes cinctipes]|uniref:HARP domain-containing protein n=1 Tax=Petrolisthes cinctipes TaxID=88211 RepID=A0AAE1GBN7_PETCI|nr:hypothetical protein Pcinc_007086 [Petrolisthes cinctipes]